MDAHEATIKVCAQCGRRFAWRKKWEKSWDAVRWCSSACRRRGRSAAGRAQNAELEAKLLELVRSRGAEKSVCPSEVARAMGGDDGWRALMEPVRQAARRLARRGLVEISQRGQKLEPDEVRGAIRLRLIRTHGA